MRQGPNDPSAGIKFETINELAFTFKKSQAHAAALDRGLFSAKSMGGSTPKALGDHCPIDLETADCLLTVICKAGGVVDRRHLNLVGVGRFLLWEAPTYLVDYLRFAIDTECDKWQGFAKNLKDFSSYISSKKLYEGDLEDPTWEQEFNAAGYNAPLPLAKRFDFSRFNHRVDFVGGSSCYAIAACDHHNNFWATLRNHPNMVKVASEFIAKNNLQDHITAQAGNNLKAANYTDGCDLNSHISPLRWYLEWLLPNHLGQTEAWNS